MNIAPSPNAARARELHVQPGVGIAAHVLQARELEILRSHVDQPALIMVDKGTKIVRPARGGAVQARPGQAIILAGNQTVDFNNTVTDSAHYEARWLVFDNALLDDAYYRERASRIESGGSGAAPARLMARPSRQLANAFDNARQSLAPAENIPAAVARQRVLEVLHWLLEAGLVVRAASANPGVAARVRALIGANLDSAWSTDRVAAALAFSEATLRRRLAAEHTSLTELLTDARMATALTLLQATARPVSDIALSVGYESASRFAVRFRQRFGFAPTAVRGHERAHQPSTNV